ncbi:MAG: AMIN domain-containing protein [Sulfurimonas sp.]|nr:AMIN domain-containing protein [Sulfurimonas sp.]
MIKVFLITIFLFISIAARENPFFPSEGEKDIPITSNIDKSFPKLKRATIQLPSYARVMKKVTVEYQNLDGSIENKSIELDNSIDWHLPIFISQSYNEQTIEIPIFQNKISKKTKFSYKSIIKIKGAGFYISKNNLKIVTKDKLLRDFLLVQPHRIVMDFKKEANFRSYIKKISDSIFTKIRIGNHSGYYRVVIELDGFYRYRLKIIPTGYLITVI